MSNLKIWWKPNFCEKDFEMEVKSITHAYIALSVCTNLDLIHGHIQMVKLYEQFPSEHKFINIVEQRYRRYRRSHGINSYWAITDNIGGLLIIENNEWVDWVDENYYDSLMETVKTLEMRGADIVKYLSEKDVQVSLFLMS